MKFLIFHTCDKYEKPFIQLDLNFHFTHTLSQNQHNFKLYQTSSRIAPESHQKLLQPAARIPPDLLQNCSRIPPDSLQQLHQPAARIPPDSLQNSSRIPPELSSTRLIAEESSASLANGFMMAPKGCKILLKWLQEYKYRREV